jgi:hypothetical protein
LTAYLSSLRRSEGPRRRAAKKRDELAPLQLIELHPLPHEPGGHGRISNWQGSVSGQASYFTTHWLLDQSLPHRFCFLTLTCLYCGAYFFLFSLLSP